MHLRKNFAHACKSGEVSEPLLHFHYVDKFFDKLEFDFPVVIPVFKIVDFALSNLLIMTFLPLKGVQFF